MARMDGSEGSRSSHYAGNGEAPPGPTVRHFGAGSTATVTSKNLMGVK